MLRSGPKPLLSFRARTFIRRSAPVLRFTLGIIIAVAFSREGRILHIDALHLNLLFLLLTVLSAARFGFLQASVFSVSALICLTYFAAPLLFLRHIATVQTLVTLILFEATALIVGRMATREKAYAAENEAQRHRTQRLHAVSHNVLLLERRQSPEKQIAEFIQREFEFDAVAVVSDLPGVAGCAGLWSADEAFTEQQLRALASTPQRTGSVSKRTLHSSKGPVGSLLILGEIPSLILDSLASLAALALERHRASVNEDAAETARKTEQFRSTVLDGLAHAFKTPLTIIRAASSGLLETGELDSTEHQLIQMIDDHAQRLDELTNCLLQTARIQGEEMRLKLESVDLPALVREVVQQFRAESLNLSTSGSEDPPIEIDTGAVSHSLAADREMIASTLKELLTNAVKYSTVGSPITITLSQSSSALTLSVLSRGAFIRVEDRDRIFERFYRGSNHRHAAPGTGIGLFVVRRVAEAHGGSTWVTSSEDAGTSFHLSLPIRLNGSQDALSAAKG